jgi:hypothetical protein
MMIEKYITRMCLSCVWSRARERSLYYKHVFVATLSVLLVCVDNIEICFTILYVFIADRAYILCLFE